MPTIYYVTGPIVYSVNRYHRKIKGGKSAIGDSRSMRIGTRSQIEVAASSKLIGTRLVLVIRHKGENV